MLPHTAREYQMKTKRIKLSSILSFAGIILITASCFLIIFSSVSQSSNVKKAAEIAAELKSLMPEPQNGFPDDRSNTSMPTAQIDGVDFSGIIEIPAFGTELPIRSDWKKSRISSYPCRLTGSMYSRDLIIGGSDNKGMFDFMKYISGGDYVFVTDMSGTRFSYRVSDIVQISDPSAENLMSDDSDLVFFAKNTYSFGYTAVRCKIDY